MYDKIIDIRKSFSNIFPYKFVSIKKSIKLRLKEPIFVLKISIIKTNFPFTWHSANDIM